MDNLGKSHRLRYNSGISSGFDSGIFFDRMACQTVPKVIHFISGASKLRLFMADQYFLTVTKGDTVPDFPHSKADLIIGSQKLSSDYTQYWAYLKDSGIDSDQLPSAEELSQKNPTSKPAILIDQDNETGMLDLVLAYDGHAWGHGFSTVSNLEDNISELVTYAKNELNLRVEHFMTTENVSKKVEEKLNDLESATDNIVEHTQTTSYNSEAASIVEEPQLPPIRQIRHQVPTSGIYASSRSSSNYNVNIAKYWLVLPVVVILAFFAGAIIFRDNIFALINGFNLASNEVMQTTQTEVAQVTATPTPTEVVVNRKEVKVRVSNGTTKNGAAGSLKLMLEDLGWVIEKVGNAPSLDVVQTTVRVKSGNSDFSEAMVKDLKSRYEAIVTADLPDDDVVDIEVVIGST